MGKANRRGNEPRRRIILGFTFKPKLAVVLAVVNGIAAGAAYIASSGDLTTTIIALAVSVGLSAGVSYYKEQESK